MHLEFRPDFDAVLERLRAYWARENHDRPILMLTSPNGLEPRAIDSPRELRDQWFDVDFRLDQFEESARCTSFHAEAVPMYMPNLGPDLMAACVGAELTFAPTTSWVEPFVDDWDTLPALRLDADNAYWQAMQRMTQTAVERARARYIVGITDLHSGADLLSAIRGRERFCMDLYDCAEAIERRVAETFRVFRETVDGLHDIILPVQGVSTSWLNVPIEGRYAALQNDFACLISPEAFNRFFRDVVEQEAAILDHSLFHVDGIGSLAQLDTLLGVPSLDGLQWVPGAGQKPMHEWIDVLARIQQGGKCIHCSASAEGVLPIVRALDPEGLLISTSARSDDEARDLMAAVERECASKRRRARG